MGYLTVINGLILKDKYLALRTTRRGEINLLGPDMLTGTLSLFFHP